MRFLCCHRLSDAFLFKFLTAVVDVCCCCGRFFFSHVLDGRTVRLKTDSIIFWCYFTSGRAWIYDSLSLWLSLLSCVLHTILYIMLCSHRALFLFGTDWRIENEKKNSEVKSYSGSIWARRVFTIYVYFEAVPMHWVLYCVCLARPVRWYLKRWN